MAICNLIQWIDINDKDVTNPAKYRILKRNQNITPPVQGLDEDLEYFVIREPFEVPEYDPRLVILKITESPIDELDEIETTLRKWIVSYAIEDRTGDDKKKSVDEVKELSNLGVFPTKKHLEYLTLYAVISRREALGLSISSEQQNILDRFEDKGQKIWLNYINGLAKKSDLDNSLPVDLDSNWETTDPEDETV